MEQEQPRRKRNNKDRPLTPRQRAIMECIIHSVESRGFPPAVREICEAVGLSSGSTVHAHLNTLEERGYIRRDPAKPRAILILRGIDGEEYTYVREEQEEAEQLEEMLNLPVVGNVAAGEPIFADENIEDKIAYPARFVRKDGAFMLRIRGNSMVNVGIFNNDYIVVEPQQVAENGEIVVALIGDEATCKTFYREKNMVRLQPENDNMGPIYVENPMIIGKVVGVLRDMHDQVIRR
ncbi:MAG: transcriptional repressor LexA [Peptococcaceae bacterium]|nr:transcriptional repressor LexA [Peptococcaceae bacterium]